MKKLVFSFCALMACFVLASCGSNPTDTLKDLTKELKDADDMSWEDYHYSIPNKALEAQIEFYSKERTEDEEKDFNEAYNDYSKAYYKASDNVEKDKKKEKEELQEKLEKAQKEYFEKKKDSKKKDKDKDKD